MIYVENITKTYKIGSQLIKAVDGITFDAKEKEIIGFIGPNGAGKTTTLRILAGVLVPDTGSVLVNEKVPWQNRVEYVKNIGVIYGNRTLLWPELTLRQSLKSLKKIYQIPNDIYIKNFQEYIELLDIDHSLIDRPIRKMSLGQRMKCEMVSCLIHSPKILFLDEPTIGMDVKTKEILRKLLESIRQKDVITIFTSHDMHEVEQICNRIIVINNGKIVADGNTKHVKRKFGEGKTLIIYDIDQESIDKLISVNRFDIEYNLIEKKATVNISEENDLNELISAIVKDKYNFEIKDIDLETLILKVF